MRIVFIQDNLQGDVVGGAEMSIQAHIDTCKYPHIVVRSKDIKFYQLKNDDFLVFGNFFDIPIALLKDFKKYKYVISV